MSDPSFLFDRGEAEPEPVQETVPKDAPLAERCRPATLDAFFGQEDILGPGKPLRKAIEEDRVPSMILWGPPGTGKTTLAKLLAKLTRARFTQLSAVDGGIKDLRKIVERAMADRSAPGRRTLLFIDEIHRWNKSQQDALLPHVESGLVRLVGATTENPSFEVNAALLSRVTVFTLKHLNDDDLLKVLRAGIEKLRSEGVSAECADGALDAFLSVAHGDARAALTALERTVYHFRGRDGGKVVLTREAAAEALQSKRILYDKSGEEHFNIISALHKSMRGSDPQGALYWLARMLEGGEDPMYIARRVIRFASEDIGLADPNALPLAIAARDAYHALGTPEGELALAQAVAYMATAPKSNALYAALDAARGAARKHGYLPVPMHIRNAPTSLMKQMGYGEGYQYDHDSEGAFAGQTFLPEAIRNAVFYEPTERGYEREIRERLRQWRETAERMGKKTP